MRIQLIHVKARRIIILISCILIFVIGFYTVFDLFYLQIFQNSNKNCIRWASTIGNSSNKIPIEQTFYSIGMKYNTDKVTTHHYDIMYEKYLRKYVGSNLTLLEIGLGCGMSYGPGASARVWREYLGPQANIHFIEFDKTCAEAWYEVHGKELGITMHYGSQEDIEFLKTVNSKEDYFDVIIDDGGHTMAQQITSFIYLLSKVRSGGIYIIEDLETSYSANYGGGYLLNNTTIELIKIFVDDIQTGVPRKTTELIERIFSFEISDSICFFNIK